MLIFTKNNITRAKLVFLLPNKWSKASNIINVVRFAFCKDILQQNEIAFCILLQNAQLGKMVWTKLTSIELKMGQIRVVGCCGGKI